MEQSQYRVETTMEEYKHLRAAKQGMEKMQKQGWIVLNVAKIDNGYGCIKTGCLGALFLPLALLGRKPQTYQVTYQRKVLI